jgi:hypothetical protein
MYLTRNFSLLELMFQISLRVGTTISAVGPCRWKCSRLFYSVYPGNIWSKLRLDHTGSLIFRGRRLMHFECINASMKVMPLGLVFGVSLAGYIKLLLTVKKLCRHSVLCNYWIAEANQLSANKPLCKVSIVTVGYIPRKFWQIMNGKAV